ncbi:GntR family transcriptional regulator [Hyphomonas adhaerens MHS-3]|uniref:GntR family transcriptional regulator n=1 Tax=Hyphomonas adhaerens MHS-3 TaxID=1280949 RepID=A0A069E9N1_9PROT|nr:PLP-dependent aminotransferase family protein [Hyphomonas adhaerens]KCZ86171.1 GntR family transcriptional regulator [Hyphomonas adhaerens MHS-3]
MTRVQTIEASALAPLLQLDRTSSLSLQDQIRRGFFNAIGSGVLPAGVRLPSSRKLADRLGVSRNTALIAYQTLIADGHLVSRERSGVFVATDMQRYQGCSMPVIGPRSGPVLSTVSARLNESVFARSTHRFPSDWQTNRYPFIEGRYDRSLFPIFEWREASRLALAAQEVETWSVDSGEADDDALIEEIRTKLLPRRGIIARPDELLITVSEQQALHLITRLFASEGTVAGVEEPGLPEMRALFEGRKARLTFLPVDDEGLIVDDKLKGCDIVHVTPSRQRPTAVTLSSARRAELLDMAAQNDFLIIEDDFECELNYLDDPIPSLRAMEGGDRVIYVASLSKVLEPGVGLGFMVAPPEVITAARRLRSLTTGRPSPNNQRAAAFFLSLGHYDSMLRRLNKVFEERLIALRDALNHYRPLSIAVAPVRGGTTYWVRGEEGLQTDKLMADAQARGVLIEAVEQYFAPGNAPTNMFRLGVTSIQSDRIRDGIAALSEAMHAVSKDGPPPSSQQATLSGEEITKTLGGVTLHYSTVYGEPCTIKLEPDGNMIGRAGSAGEDKDTGRWWVEGEKWYRQWQRWAFTEVLGFRISVDGQHLSWLDDSGRVVDSAVIMAPSV